MTTKAERRAAWKERTSEHAAALKKAKATVTLGGQRSISLKATTPAKIRVEAWQAKHTTRTIVDPVTGKHRKVINDYKEVDKNIYKYIGKGKTHYIYAGSGGKTTVTGSLHLAQAHGGFTFDKAPTWQQIAHAGFAAKVPPTWKETAHAGFAAQVPLTHLEEARAAMLSGAYKYIQINPNRVTFTDRLFKDILSELKYINALLSKQVKKVTFTHAKYVQMGINYVKRNPKRAKLIFGALHGFAAVRGVAYYIGKTKEGRAFAEGATVGLNEMPTKKTITETEAERKKRLVEMGITVPYERGESLASIKKRQAEFDRRREAALPKWITNFTGRLSTLTKAQNKIVQNVFATDGSITKNKAALTSFQNYVFKEVKKNPEKIAQFASFPAMIRIGATAATRYGVTQLITKIPHGKTIARNTVKIVFAAVGAVYTYNVLDRVTEPVVTGYKDGKTTTKTKTLPNGDKEITTTTEQVPQYRMPTRAEQVERLGGILATELLAMKITHSGIKRGMNKGYTSQPKIKPKVKISIKITRAGKVIKTIPAKIKTIPGKVIKAPKTIKTKAQKAKEARAIKKRHEKLKTEAKKAEKQKAKEKVPVLKATKQGELQLLRTKRSKLLKEQSKAKGKQRTEIKKRLNKVEKELAFKEAFKPKKKVVVLSNSTYAKITKLSRLKAKIKALIAKIRAIPAAVAKRMGINKTKEIKKLTVRLREVDVVKSYIVMVKKGVPKKTVVDKLQKLPENKLQVLDTKTGKIIKNIEKTVDDIELKVIKPSKKPPVGYKEVRVGKGLVQLQKQTQKSAIKTVVLTKTELKSLNVLNVKAKTITQTKPKTTTAIKTRQRQLQKVTSQIRSKQKVLLLYQQRLKSKTAELKQIQKSLTLLATKQTPKQATFTRQRIISISTQIHKIAAVLSLISSTLITTKQILSTTSVVKPPIIVPFIPAIPLPKKAKAIKKKKKASIAYEDWFIKNIIPTLKSLYGF